LSERVEIINRMIISKELITAMINPIIVSQFLEEGDSFKVPGLKLFI